MALRLDSVPLLKVALKYRLSFKQRDKNGVTPKAILKSLPSGSTCRKYLKETVARLAQSNPNQVAAALETLQVKGEVEGEGAESQEAERRRQQKQQNQQIEDIKLQVLFSSNLSLEGWKSFLHDVQQHEFKLTKYGSEEVVAAVVEALAFESSPTSPRSIALLRGLTSIIETCPSMAKVLDKCGPSFVRERLPLGAVITSAEEAKFRLAREFACDLIELCPTFCKWRDFIDVPHGPESAKLDLFFSKLTSATSLLSNKELSHRLRKKLSDRLLEDSKLDEVPEEARPEEARPEVEDDEDSPAAALEVTIKTVMERVFRHQEERQREILDQAENLALTVIRQIEVTLAKAVEARDTARADGCIREMTDAIEKLVTIQRGRRERRAKRYREKVTSLREALEKAKALPQAGRDERLELITTFLTHTPLHEGAISWLEGLYDEVLRSRDFLNPARELRYLDSLIGELYAISISLVITGPISVGKSTIVNCIVGQNISPNRTETMTAIPVRYLHDPKAKVPKMLVPFADQLNVVIARVRAMAEGEGLENVKYLLRKTHLTRLVDAITQGLTIRPEYEGIPDIRQASTTIHDLFRLAVDDAFGDQLATELPLDWSQGLDTYLTVNLKFPGVDLLDGLVEFSVVDTPGINEAGVKKLRLAATIRDTLQACKYAALVTNPSGYADTGLSPLRKMFHEIKDTLRTPVMAYVTNLDNLGQKDAGDVRQNISSFLTSEKGDRLFEVDNIFVVSALRKVLGTRMKEYIDTHQRKPLIGDLEEPEAAALAEEWAHFAGFGDTPKEKIDYYEGLTQEALLTRSIKLVELSNMDEPLNRMTREALSNGIPTSVRHAIMSATHRIESVTKKLSSDVSSENIRTALQRGQAYMAQLVKLQTALENEVGRKSTVIKTGIRDQIKAITRDLASWTRPLSADSPAATQQPTFFTTFVRYLKALDDPRALELVTSENPVAFSSKPEAEKVLSCLPVALRRAMEEVILSKSEGVSQDMSTWGANKKSEVREMFKTISKTYAQCVDVRPSEKVAKGMELALSDLEKLSMSYDPDAQLLIRKHKKKGAISVFSQLFSGKGGINSYTVDPKDVRKHLIEMSTSLLDGIQVVLEVQVDGAVTKSLKPFVDDNVKELLRLQGIVQEKMVETESRKQRESRPRRDLAATIDRTLSSGQLLVSLKA